MGMGTRQAHAQMHEPRRPSFEGPRAHMVSFPHTVLHSHSAARNAAPITSMMHVASEAHACMHQVVSCSAIHL